MRSGRRLISIRTLLSSHACGLLPGSVLLDRRACLSTRVSLLPVASYSISAPVLPPPAEEGGVQKEIRIVQAEGGWRMP